MNALDDRLTDLAPLLAVARHALAHRVSSSTSPSSTPPCVPLTPPVVLLGPPGAGKSTLAPRLAAVLGLRLIVLDDVAEASRLDASPRSLAAFRLREHLALKTALAEGDVLVDAGAGVVDLEENRALLRNAWPLHLDIPLDVAAARLHTQRDHDQRPWLEGAVDVASVLTALRSREAGRRHRRADVAVALLEEATSDIDQRVEQAQRALAVPLAALRGPALEPFATWGPDHWPVTAGLDPARGLVVVADPAVADAVALPDGAALHVVPDSDVDGERKRLATVEHLLQSFAAHGLHRRSTVVAVGGGELLDMVGLACSLYHRGIAWRAVPTTLLALVDAGLGGKTAVDLALPAGEVVRNGVGAFWPAQDTLLSTAPLARLSAAQVRHGEAEHLKHLLLMGAPLERTQPLIDDVDALQRTRAFKAAVVVADPTERHLRQALNLGHTLAHALEAHLHTPAQALAHGDAVLHGLRFALWLSVEVAGLPAGDAVTALDAVDALSAPRLPSLTADDARALWQRMGRDKKAVGGHRFVVLCAPGVPALLSL